MYDAEMSTDESHNHFSSHIIEIPNAVIRYPWITVVNGIYNILHGLGSFWYHACECDPGGATDVAGMLAVTSFPLWMIPSQLAIGVVDRYVSHVEMFGNDEGTMEKKMKRMSRCAVLTLSLLPPICQTIIWITAYFGMFNRTTELFMGLSILSIPMTLVYLYFWRNKRTTERNGLICGQRHILLWWLIPLGILFFALAWIAWLLDKQKRWCFQDPSLRWIQGHATWHFLASISLVCLYWYYRSEKIIVTITTEIDQKSEETRVLEDNHSSTVT